MAMLKLGILGAGHFGRFHALKAAKAAGEGRVEFLGLADASAERAALVASEAGTRVWQAPELIAAADALIVAAPTAFHFDLASAVLRAGRHVFVEKPIAATLAEADALVALAAEAGRVLQVGHVERFGAGFATLLSSAGLGRPLYMEAVRIAPFRPRGLDVSVVLDLMIHDLDLVLSLAGGALEEVQAVGAAVCSDRVDIANARLRFAGGAQATITASRASLKMERRLRVFGTEGYASLDFLAREIKLVRKGQGAALEQLPGHGIETLSWQDHDNLEAEQAAFIRACGEGTPAVVDGRAGRAALDAALRVEAAIAASLTAAGLPFAAA
ncbi:Gfo/Idh/MocA family protein [Roseomonas marmotae]|uniref:Gfo/Idh/MocA family oxidoreductase n=1 Tax=Roseomonas marmotae TaxID=2768161 RepID=A0ABS3KA88_9PROT|nr:Gfo/Idh/MocA family oxidoreductase [Roseomonas marmotae]MBO1074363.1 Gfo/Idh/MocA family oxidoreductase [Roseomonas marmotae]QTI78109.1 Gfo/Idh/MocA family oxidoreductase [Roseomonas marmotae]